MAIHSLKQSQTKTYTNLYPSLLWGFHFAKLPGHSFFSLKFGVLVSLSSSQSLAGVFMKIELMFQDLILSDVPFFLFGFFWGGGGR